MKIKSCQDQNLVKSGAETIVSSSSFIYLQLIRNIVYSHLERLREKDKVFTEHAIKKDTSTNSTDTSDKLVGHPDTKYTSICREIFYIQILAAK